MKKATKIFLGGMVFVIGIICATINLYFVLVIAGIFGAVLLLFLRDYKIGFLFFIFLLAIFRAQIDEVHINDQHIAFYNEKNVVFQGVIRDEVERKADKQKFVVQVDSTQGHFSKGRVLVSAELYPEYFYGDQVQIFCELKTPEPIEDFEYDKYLARKKIFSLCYRPQARVLAREQGNWFLQKIFAFKKQVLQKINLTLPEPHASFLAGILIGARTSIPRDLMEQFNRTGITHVVAMSGYNITILAALIMNIAVYCFIRRQYAFWCAVLAIVCFVIMTGAPASIVRAGIMGLIVLLARQLGQLTKIRNVLVLTLGIMLLINPLAWQDAGLQLSFVATLGLIYFAPHLEKYFSWVPKQFALRENLISTLSAIIFTLPLIIYYFGRVSLVAPLVNFLVLPIMPVLMLFGFAQIGICFVSMFVGKFFSIITWTLLSYVLKIVDFFANFPVILVHNLVDNLFFG